LVLLKSVNTGSFNTGVGAGTLVLNTGDENTAIGTAAILLNTASGNTAVGSRALLHNTTGGTLGNIQGVDVGPNVAVGQQALEGNTVASANTAVGYQALQSFTTGPIGLEQIGLCTAVGFQALANANVNGFANSAFGYNALMNNTDGGGNTAIGLQALVSNTTGSSNVAIGNNALSNSTGDNNTALGFNAGSAVTTANNLICIGAFGANVDNSCFIGNIYSNVQPIVGTDPDSVTINSSGRLGRGNVSSRRYKHDIKPMDKASEALYALKPVSFRYNKEYDGTQTVAFGLIAEEVAEVYPDLVGRNPKGEPESVRYDQVNAMYSTSS
jgi:Chaperone of endosialidase